MNWHFLAYATKVFGLAEQLRQMRDKRPYPEIPTRAVVLSLLMIGQESSLTFGIE